MLMPSGHRPEGIFFATMNNFSHRIDCLFNTSSMCMLRLLLLSVCCLLLMPASGQTLQEALTAKDTALALSLIQKGADPNTADANGTTALMQACHFPDLTTAGFLLRH